MCNYQADEWPENSIWNSLYTPSPRQGEGWDGGRTVQNYRYVFFDRHTPTLALPLRWGGKQSNAYVRKPHRILLVR